MPIVRDGLKVNIGRETKAVNEAGVRGSSNEARNSSSAGSSKSEASGSRLKPFPQGLIPRPEVRDQAFILSRVERRCQGIPRTQTRGLVETLGVKYGQ